MRQQGTSGEPPERRYDETMDPANPPKAVLGPQVRGWAVRTYLGGLLVLFLVIGAALIHWTVAEPGVERDPEVAGTTGEMPTHEPSPGGFDPRSSSRSTEHEMRYRGLDSSVKGSHAPQTDAQRLVGTADRAQDDPLPEGR